MNFQVWFQIQHQVNMTNAAAQPRTSSSLFSIIYSSCDPHCLQPRCLEWVPCIIARSHTRWEITHGLMVPGPQQLPCWELCCFYPMTHGNEGHWVLGNCAIPNTPFHHWIWHWSWDKSFKCLWHLNTVLSGKLPVCWNIVPHEQTKAYRIYWPQWTVLSWWKVQHPGPSSSEDYLVVLTCSHCTQNVICSLHHCLPSL